jgi:tetratricopeptide (TPR) repeat protein
MPVNYFNVSNGQQLSNVAMVEDMMEAELTQSLSASSFRLPMVNGASRPGTPSALRLLSNVSRPGTSDSLRRDIRNSRPGTPASREAPRPPSDAPVLRQRLATRRAAHNKAMKKDAIAVSKPGFFCRDGHSRVDSNTAAQRRAFKWATDEKLSPDKKERAGAWFNYANFQKNMDYDLEKAVDSLEHAVDLENGGTCLTHYELGNCEEQRGKWHAARQHYKRALQMRFQPRFEVQNAIAMCYLKELRMPVNYYNKGLLPSVASEYAEAARGYFDEAAQSAQEHGGLIYFNKGLLEKQQGDNEKAAVFFRVSAVGHEPGLNPKDPNTPRWEPYEPADFALNDILQHPDNVHLRKQFANDVELHEQQRHMHDLHSKARTGHAMTYDNKLRQHMSQKIQDMLDKRRAEKKAFDSRKFASAKSKRWWGLIKREVRVIAQLHQVTKVRAKLDEAAEAKRLVGIRDSMRSKLANATKHASAMALAARAIVG